MKEMIFTILRDRSSTMEQFRMATDQLGTLLAVESDAYISKKKVEVKTPIGTATGSIPAAQILLVAILRAGLTLLPPFLRFYPNALVGLIGEKRDETTALPQLYYTKLPPFNENTPILLLDPMLATGGSACLAIKILKDAGAKESQITLISAIAAPEGIEKVKAEHPGTFQIIAQIDQKLNEDKYIVPGLGDFGDRYFGTI